MPTDPMFSRFVRRDTTLAGVDMPAGSVIHAMHHEQDMRNMGGLAPKLRITWAMMLIGTLSLTGVGIPHLAGFAGFHSKDAIIEAAYAAHTPENYAFWLLVAAAFMTSFYSWRLMFLTFHGRTRADHDTYEHAHESPWVMLVPLLVLALGAVVAYFAGGLAMFRSLSRKLKWAWIAGAALIGMEIGVTAWVMPRLDFNPRVSRQDACGAWSGHGLSLELRGDQTYVAGPARGHWSLLGHALKLEPEPEGFSTPRFVRYDSRLRLREIAGDPDDWAGELGLWKVNEECGT